MSNTTGQNSRVTFPIPLTDRPANAALFCLPGRIVTAGSFAADVRRLAAALPDASYAINLCSERYAFTVGFAAALHRRQTSLLSGGRSPDALAALARRFPGSYVITDSTAASPLPCILVPPPGDAVATIPSYPADYVAAIVFTSGSTGTPVAHSKTWQTLVERSRDGGAAFGLTAHAPVTIIGTVPPHHMYGFETTVLLPLHAPASVWCGPAFYPADIRYALTVSPGPHVLVTTPLQLRALMDVTSLPPISRIISATAPLDPVMAAAAEAQLGTIVSEIFGASEVGSIAFRRTTDGPDWTLYAQVRLAAAVEGLLVTAPGSAGIVLDDTVDLMADGRFRLLGRRSDVVKMGGRRASLAGLNRMLAAIAGVEDGVFLPPAADDHRASARMTALVVAPCCEDDAILAALRPQIDPVFLPRRIIHLDRLPRNEMGKLPVEALRALQAAS